MQEYFYVNDRKIPIQSLRYNSKSNQIEAMREWFYQNYEDPANACPYESREGGYQYIYGGPYDAAEELQHKFEGYVNQSCIDELVEELQYECDEWSGSSDRADWYDDDVYDAVISSLEPYNKFYENVGMIRVISQAPYPAPHKRHLLGILYTNVITALETFYVELFINSIEKNDSYIANCIEKGKTDYKVSKEIASLPFKGNSIEDMREELIKSIKENLISASWHSTDKVVKRFKATFGFETQNDWPIEFIEKATHIRNHLVHRGGQDKEGNSVVITDEDLESLLSNATLLAQKLLNSVHDTFNQ